MKSIDELFSEMEQSVATNDQSRFDVLERDLLSRFDGGFNGMPVDIYQRYLKVDRRWPAIASNENTSPSRDRRTGAGRPVGPLGPKTMVSARLPEPLLEWLKELASTCDSNRSEVLTTCLLVVRNDPSIEKLVLERLAEKKR